MDDQKREEMFRAFIARVEKYGDRKAIAKLEAFMQMGPQPGDDVIGERMFELEIQMMDSLYGPSKEPVLQGRFPKQMVAEVRAHE